jgi:hypothetical protein
MSFGRTVFSFGFIFGLEFVLDWIGLDWIVAELFCWK